MRDLTEEAIGRVDAGADSDWKECALFCIETLAISQPELTAEEARALLIKNFPHLTTRDNRAMGAVMRRAVKEGWVTSTQTFRESVLPHHHRGLCRVWISQLFLTAQPGEATVTA